jgi:hypothetical protein
MTQELTAITKNTGSNYGKNAAFYLIANDDSILSIQKYDPMEDKYTERAMNTNLRISANSLPYDLLTAMREVQCSAAGV